MISRCRRLHRVIRSRRRVVDEGRLRRQLAEAARRRPDERRVRRHTQRRVVTEAVCERGDAVEPRAGGHERVVGVVRQTQAHIAHGWLRDGGDDRRRRWR
jgi:hypothetical protein